MTGLEAVAGPTVVKIGVAVIQRATPGGIALIRSLLRGKEIVVVGQERAGKTTFIDYLRYGLFEDEKETDKTPRATPTARFDVKVGRDSALELNVKTVWDVAGQKGPVDHADIVFAQRPHAVVIFTDLTTPFEVEGDLKDSSGVWLTEFCRRLESQWRVKGRRGNRIRSVIIVMNKHDRVEEQAVVDRRKVFRDIVHTELREARGKMVDEVAIIPCTMVSNSNATKEVDSVIAHLAKALAT